jgi:hypothetical protein
VHSWRLVGKRLGEAETGTQRILIFRTRLMLRSVGVSFWHSYLNSWQ